MPKIVSLTELRTRRRMTQEALATQSGISQEHISRLEIGRSIPTQATLDALASVLGDQVYKIRFGTAKVYRKLGRPRKDERRSETT